MIRESKAFLWRWWGFSKERFSPSTHIPFIALYFSANLLVALNSCGIEITLEINVVLCAVIVLLAFYRLRIFDEIKDYEADRIVHSNRPLARGVISLREAKRVAAILIMAELSLGAVVGFPALLAVGAVVLYSLFMYKEFFVGTWLRQHLAAYALTHTLVSCWISLLVFSGATGRHFWQIPREYGMFVIVNWMLFNIFEFGRKTFGKEEEKTLADSYSRNLGPLGAALSVLFMEFIAIGLAFMLGKLFGLGLLFFVPMGLLSAVALLTAVAYARVNSGFWARLFRGTCSLFIFLYNIIFTVGLLKERFP